MSSPNQLPFQMSSHNQLPFQNTALCLEERVLDLIGRLTLDEKCSQLRYDSPGIERLGIPQYNWWNEALHGVGRAGRATVFPQAINLSFTWDVKLVEQVASAIADEARAKHHYSASTGSRQRYQGLTFWTPNINIFRDPRWGRGQETWGEDPFLTGELAAAFVRGLQGTDPFYLKTAACAKHFAVHSGPERDRHSFDANPPLKDFYETYLPAFKRLVEEGVEAVMPAYNRVYGEPCAGSDFLLKEILRANWDFKGHVVSDCWAIRDFHLNHKVTRTSEESAAKALKAGCDLNCGDVYCESLLDAVKLKLCEEKDVDLALSRILRTRFRLGMFDPEQDVPYARISMDVVGCPAHRELARDAARRSMILLKNHDQTLPLKGGLKYLVVGGPQAANIDVMLGNYFGLSSSIVTVLEGIAARIPENMRLDYRKGCLPNTYPPNRKDWLLAESSKADVVVLAMGQDPSMEGEEGDAISSPDFGDRQRIELPPNQVEFLQKLRDGLSKRGCATKLVVLIFGGSPIALPEVHEIADALLFVGYPGEVGGTAIADILFGDYSPEAKFTFTTPVSTDSLPDYSDYSMKGRTFRYMDPSRILYPMGFGLSYTQFTYSFGFDNSILKQLSAATFEVRAIVKNAGQFNGAEIVQCYIRFPETPETESFIKLVGFQRVELDPGESQDVFFKLSPEQFCRFNELGEPVPIKGCFRVYAGGVCPVPVSEILGAGLPLCSTLQIG